MSCQSYQRIGVALAALSLGLVVFPQSASACRIRQFTAGAVARADAAVVVELTEVTPQGDNTFQARAVARRPVFGTQSRELFEFGGYSVGASCGPIPEIGDLWVVYLRGEAGAITAFYPFGYAEVLDPRVGVSGVGPGSAE